MEPRYEISDEFVKNQIARGKEYCLRLFIAGPHRNQPPEEAERIQMEHLKYALQLKAAGVLLINGPVIDDPRLRGISIFNTTDVEEVRRISDGDPAVKAGRLVYEIYPWFGIPGDCLPIE